MGSLMHIEILHVRDPDSECFLRVFVDGVETEDFIMEDVDPGRGYTREDWDERITDARNLTDVSDAFGEAVVATLELNGDSEFIEDRRP